MRTSRFLLATLRETPADAEVVSHRLMLKAGMIRKLASGCYTWLPLGLRVLRKIENIVRQEMNRAGAQELLMPVVQPAELWRESGRWDQFGPELLRFKDRHQRDFCFGPTHEEVITDLIRREIQSYRQLPANFYQIQTKFRDEIRPRFGVMRAREFLMKDAYSFHVDEGSLEETYQRMFEAYSRIFRRCGLDFRAVQADTGAIGGSVSHEFHVLADAGEDAIGFSDAGDYAANVEMIPAPAVGGPRRDPAEKMTKVATPGRKSVEQVSVFLGVEPFRVLKTLIVHGHDGSLVGLVLRGDHELNVVKAEKLDEVAVPLRFAGDSEIRAVAGCGAGSIGPVGLNIPLIVDASAARVSDFVCGANEDGQHLKGVNWGRDLPEPKTADLRNITAGEPSPDGRGSLVIRRGIEVGHIFQLGRKYSEAMSATCLDEQGRSVPMIMGCYGIGVSRVVAAAIEQNHDDSGIIWPQAIAPFELALVAINAKKRPAVRDAAEHLYRELTAVGIEVLYDDRDERPGVMFNDLELIGIPHRLVVGERALARGQIEYKRRVDGQQEQVDADQAVTFVQRLLGQVSYQNDGSSPDP